MDSQKQLQLAHRLQVKGNKLEYFYQIEPKYAHLPLLGSAIRALGKEWQVEVVASDNHLDVFDKCRQLLKDPSSLILNPATPTASQLCLLLGLDEEKVETLRNQAANLGKKHLMVTGTKADDSYDLVSDFVVSDLNKTGVTAITGTGKGKTTTALGLAAQEFLYGKKTAVVQWFKERKTGRLTWAINEHFFPQVLNQSLLIEFVPTGLGFFGSPSMDRVGEYQEHRQKAYDGLEYALKILKSGEYGLIVLDEFVDTIPQISQNIQVPLIDLKDARQLLKQCANQTQTKVVVTGRRVTQDWSEYIGKSIVITEVKHPWSSKRAGAVSGLDF